jgi:hypothetical protein
VQVREHVHVLPAHEEEVHHLAVVGAMARRWIEIRRVAEHSFIVRWIESPV